MSLAVACAALMFVGIILYALLAGADFGAGLWDLLAGGDVPSRSRREPAGAAWANIIIP